MHAAFILIVTDKEKPFSVAEQVSGIENVEFAHTVTGPYDVIAYVKTEEELADKLKDIAKEVLDTDGVLDTLTCIAVH